MTKYILNRVLFGLLSIFTLITITFFLIRFIPGSPFQSENVSPEILELIEREYGLKESVLIQYKTYILNLLKGDLGVSLKKTGVNVIDIIKREFPLTLSLGVISLLVSFIFGIFIGIINALINNKFVKYLISFFISLSVSIPNFIVSLLLILIFSVKFKIFPASGLYTPFHYVLPVISLSLYPTAFIAKLTSSNFLDIINEDYIIMAKAKGLKKRDIIFKYLLKNSIIPIISYMGMISSFLITGSFVIENAFTIPGIGKEFVNSISNRDYTVIMGLTIFMGVIVISVNIVADIICAVIDKRIKFID